MSTTPNYDINYDDERFTQVESAKDQALTELENTYAGMIGSADKYYDAQIQASKDWADKQAQIQQDNTDFAIEQIEQQKDQANKDYIKEQSGAYVDWRKQSNQYGTEAEKMASAGLTNTGYSESSQVSMYNTYQNRVATARESYNRAVLNYNNAIKDAQLQNNAALAEIAYNALQQQLELSLQGFQYKNQLILEQANKKTELDNIYYNRYQDVLQQINTENAMAEDIRQYNETMKWNTEQKELDRQHDSAEKQLDRQFQERMNQVEMNFKARQAELDRDLEREIEKAKNAHEKEMAKINHDNKVAQMQAEYLYQKALLTQEYDLKKQSVGTVSGNSSGSSGSNTKVSYQTISGTQKQTSSQPTVNMNSVMALGYGPISATRLAELEAQGKIESYVKNGQIYYKKVPARATTKMESLNQTLTSKYGTTTGKSVSSSSTTKNTTYVPLLKGNAFK